MFVVRVAMFAAVAVLSSCSNLDANFYVPPQVTNPVVKLNRDFNGDSNSDFIVASQRLGHLFFGTANVSGVEELKRLPTVRPNDISTINALGDINRDGFGDYATSDSNCGGRVDVYLGSRLNSNSPISVSSPENACGNLPADFFNVIGSENRLEFGAGVYPLGDVNGDQFADFAIVETKYMRLVQPLPSLKLAYGRVHVYHGNANGFEKAPYFIEATASDPLLYFASGGITNGDFNSDGVSDIAVASYNYESNSSENRVHIYYGQKQSPTHPGGLSFIEVQTNDGDPAIFIKVAQPDVVITHNEVQNIESSFGNAVVSGDFNGDGHLDLAVGAHKDPEGCSESSTTRCGAVYVFNGSAQGFGANGATMSSASAVRLDFPGSSSNAAEFGGALAAIDLNSDGVDDLVVGAAEATRGTGKGYVYLFRGSSSGIETQYSKRWYAELGVMDSNGGIPGIRFDYSLSNVGDINKDGKADLMISSSNSLKPDHGILVLGSSSEINSYQVLPFWQEHFQFKYFGQAAK